MLVLGVACYCCRQSDEDDEDDKDDRPLRSVGGGKGVHLQAPATTRSRLMDQEESDEEGEEEEEEDEEECNGVAEEKSYHDAFAQGLARASCPPLQPLDDCEPMSDRPGIVYLD